MKALILGDVCPTVTTDPLFKAKDKEALFGNTLPLFEGNDIFFINLECALTEGGRPIKKYGPNLRGCPETAEVLADIGVTHCGLSNNHVLDFSSEGIADTKKALEGAGITYTGFGDNYEDSRKNLVIEKDGETVTFITVCEHEYTYALEDRMGSRPFDEYDTMEDIREARKTSDRVIVIYHGGKEHCRYPSPRLRKLCHAMIRNGADLVVGQHSHCISCYEQYESGHILYGQGNFHFVRPKMPECWNDCLALHYDTKTNEVAFTPLVSSVDRIHLADEKEAKDILCSFDMRNKSLKDGTWIDGWKAFCDEVKQNYRKAIGGAGKDDSSCDDDHFFAHYLDCEAHTDVWRELFKTAHYTNEI
jgi:poly-gamma-glutamate synthesis protein (capsule biosynthesis protein)